MVSVGGLMIVYMITRVPLIRRQSVHLKRRSDSDLGLGPGYLEPQARPPPITAKVATSAIYIDRSNIVVGPGAKMTFSK